MRVEDAGDAILEEHRFVRQPDQMVVDVAEAVGELLADERKFAPRQAPDRIALRQHDLAQRRDVFLEVQDPPGELRVGLLEDFLSSSSSRSESLSTSGPIVVDHRIDDAVQQHAGTFAEDAGVSGRPAT